MQERYLGDSHHFLKYALLRHLHGALRATLGVNWYLTRPELVDRPNNNDGEKRHHLRGKDWPATDPELFAEIGKFEHPSERRIEKIEEWGILPSNTLYHDEHVGTAERDNWQARAVENLDHADLVFLDPDNGFEVPSMSLRTSPKYSFYREACDFVRRGKIVVGIQFARQCDPIQRAKDVRGKLLSEAGSDTILPVIRGRVAPNILFISHAPPTVKDEVGDALRSFASKCHKAELVE